MTNMMTPDFDGLPKYPTRLPRPTKAVVREVDIEVPGTDISLRFARGISHSGLDDAKFAALLTRLAGGDLSPGATGTSFDPTPQGEHNSPLSANNQGLTYVVYVLSGKDWEFSIEGPPITIAKKSLPKSAYFEARSVGAGGETTGPGRKVAYLIADGDAAHNGGPNYEDRINLHVDIVMGDQRIPIIIDPDIRNPGGSEP